VNRLKQGSALARAAHILEHRAAMCTGHERQIARLAAQQRCRLFGIQRPADPDNPRRWLLECGTTGRVLFGHGYDVTLDDVAGYLRGRTVPVSTTF
jgi:hypothetical protein